LNNEFSQLGIFLHERMDVLFVDVASQRWMFAVLLVMAR